MTVDRDRLAAALVDWTGAWTRAERADLIEMVQALVAEGAAAAATDALMWAAWTVEHSPGIKHQARAVTAIRARAAALAPAASEATT